MTNLEYLRVVCSQQVLLQISVRQNLKDTVHERLPFFAICLGSNLGYDISTRLESKPSWWALLSGSATRLQNSTLFITSFIYYTKASITCPKCVM